MEPTPVDHTAAMEFVVQLGAALIQAGTAVDEVHHTVQTAAEHLGIRDPRRSPPGPWSWPLATR